jgi:hypothetical protein
MTNTTTAAATARPIAQRKWTAVGWENGGRSNGLSAHAENERAQAGRDQARE